MIREVIATGKTVALALEAGAAELGRTPDRVQHEVLEEGKKGLFGIGAAEAKVRVFIPETPAIRAVEFLEKLIEKKKAIYSSRMISELTEGLVKYKKGE